MARVATDRTGKAHQGYVADIEAVPEEATEMAVTRLVLRMIAGILGVAAWGCGPASTGVSDGLEGSETGVRGTSATYLYAGCDSSGREIVRGEIVVAVDDSGIVTGSWNLNAVGDSSPMIGPQVGQGKLVGRIEGTVFGAGLNPDMVDNNVVLLGTIVADSITGIWEFIGFAGVLNRGTFSATRKR